MAATACAPVQDGTPIYTFYLATALTDAEDEQHWNWKLRPEVSNAIKALGLDVEVVAAGSTKKAMDMLENKQVDAFAADQVILIGQVISRGGRADYSLSNELFSFEPFALALQRGDADFQLVADRVLSALNRSGRISQIYKKWFGSFGEKPPNALEALYQLNSTPD